MIGVEVPDYSGVYVFVCIVIALAATIAAATPALRNSRFINYFTRQDEKRSLDNMESRMKSVQYGTPQPKPNCGYIRPGEWFCNCGKIECKAFEATLETVKRGHEEIAKGAGPHPKPDRKAAIKHTKSKP
jgi:hypothetical protein